MRFPVLDLDITALGADGKGQALWGERVVCVPFTVPGQKIRAQVVKRKQQRVTAKVLEVLAPAPGQVPPACRHFGQPPSETGSGCGGCQWQMLPYADQLQLKRSRIEQLLALLPAQGVPLPELEAVIPSPQALHYRNKVELSFGDRTYIPDAEYLALKAAKAPIPQGFYLGFHVPQSFGTLVDVQRCELMDPAMQQVYQTVRDALPLLGGDVYNPRKHTGFWRYLGIRAGYHTGDVMLHINTTDTHQPNWAPLLKDLQDLNLGRYRLRSVLHSVYTGKSQIMGYEPFEVLMGDPYIEDRLFDLTFQISPYAFFQTNTQAAERLYEVVAEFAALQGQERIYDLYSGTGTIAQVLAAQGAGQVWGLEEIASAVTDAQANAERNQLNNCHFRAGKVEDELPALMAETPADVIIVDPPRAGLHPKVVKMLRQQAAPTLIYVSCNPEALAHDLLGLCAEGLYQVTRMRPVDLFPQTAHIETVVRLERV